MGRFEIARFLDIFKESVLTETPQQRTPTEKLNGCSAY
jgi:hypothetical protein